MSKDECRKGSSASLVLPSLKVDAFGGSEGIAAVGFDDVDDATSLSPSSAKSSVRTPEESPKVGSETESFRQVRRKDRVFTDKDRAASVVIGEQDIKSLVDRRDTKTPKRDRPEYRIAATYHSQSRFLMSQGRWKEAIRYLNQALAMEPEQKEWIMSRATCYFRLFEMSSALSDVDKALTMDGDPFSAMRLKAEILYATNDLEESLIYFSRAHRLRPRDKAAYRGVLKVEESLGRILVPENSGAKKVFRSKKKLCTKLKTRKLEGPTAICSPQFDFRYKATADDQSVKDQEVGASRTVNSDADEAGESTSGETRSDICSAGSLELRDHAVDARRPSVKGQRFSSARSQKATKSLTLKQDSSGSFRKPIFPRHLAEDAEFLEMVLRKKTSYAFSPQVLQMFRRAYSFVCERQRFWQARGSGS